MITLRLAEFAVSGRHGPEDRELAHAATRALVDWYGATLAGASMAPAQALRRALLHQAGHGRARLVPEGTQVDARTAALVNATASHTVEMDDIFREGVYHPGSPTIGAALATAEHLGVGGDRLLRAVAVGYEIGDRVAAAVQPAHYRFWHTTGTVGTIGAAAAVAELLELPVEPFAHALASATTMAAGLQQAFRSDAMSKPLHAGHAADAGTMAAMAASEGLTGALDILDGEVGFGAAMSDGPDWERALASLGSPWGITQATVKNHSCCGHTFAAVDAALELRAEGVRADQVESVEIDTYTTATKVAGNVGPRTDFEAKFSLSYCVAAALRLGGVRLGAFSAQSLADPALRDLESRTMVRPTAEFDADFPGRRRARVTLRLRDGSTVTRLRNTRRGDPDDPLSDTDLDDKFHDLAGAVIGPENARTLSAALWGVGGREDLGTLPAFAIDNHRESAS